MQKLNEEKENCMEIEKLDTRTLNNGTSMPIGKNFFRAKLKDRKQWIEGFYCRINETTYCTTDDYQKEPVKVQHLIATERSTDWGMPNQIAFYEIDPATLCQYTGISKKIKKYGRMILSVIMVYMRLSDTVNIRVVLIARRLHISDFL